VIDLHADALRGSYPPLVTPLVDGRIDEDAYGRLVEIQLAQGSRGVVVGGTSGEPSLLTLRERQRLAEVAIEAAAGRLSVVVATGSQSLTETIELTEHATAAGADALMIVTPYYVLPPERGLVGYYTAVGASTDLPLLLYHIPRRTGLTVSVQALEAIADACPTFVGVKHSSADLSFVSQAIRTFGPGLRLFVGLEELTLPMLALGACGMVSAAANVVPDRVANLYEAVADSRLDDARRLHYELLDFNEAVFWDTNPIAVKYMMRRLGLLERNEHRLPMAPATPELEARLDALLHRAGLLEPAETR
jgi:4-hydroxy-tetrahydrodipicolinate synthase